MTVAVSCVQSAISLQEETPAFFFSVWSKHVLTASHSILKHLQLGADEDIKKTHPKHLCQPAVKNLLLSPASPRCRGSRGSFFWLYNRSAQHYTDKSTAMESSCSASPGTCRWHLVPTPAQVELTRHPMPATLSTNTHRMLCRQQNAKQNHQYGNIMETQMRRAKEGKGEAAAGKGGQLLKKGYPAPGSWKWKKMVWAEDERCRNWRGELKTNQKTKRQGPEMPAEEREAKRRARSTVLPAVRTAFDHWPFLTAQDAGLFWVFQCSGF